METPEDIAVKLKVIGDKTGLKRISGDFLGLAGDLAEPLLLLSTGASKAQVAWAGFRGVMEAKVLGPLSLVAGASTAALLGINKLAKGFSEFGMTGAANLEAIETRFKAVLRSQILAGERIRENVELAKDTPFDQQGVMEANRALEILTQGALSTKEGMLLVGDAIATAGEELQDVSKWVGRLYDALQSGSPIGEAAMRLQEMGLITGGVRRTLDSMVDSGASFSDMWGVVENQLKKSEGAMKDLSENLEGLQSTLDDTRQVMLAKFSEGFLEGEKASIDATTKSMEALTPVVEYFGGVFGGISNRIEKGRASMSNFITQSDLFAPSVKIAGQALLTMLTIMSAAGAAAVLKFSVGLIKSTAASYKLTTATGVLATAQNVQASAVMRLGKANSVLIKGVTALRAGNYALALSYIKLSAQQLLAAVRTNFASVAAIGLKGVMKGLGATISVVTNLFRSLAASLIANPMLLVAAGVLIVIAALVKWNSVMKEAQQRLEDFNKATNDIVAGLEAQQRAIKTTTDLMKAHNNAVNALADARKALAAAEREGSKEEQAAAKRRVDETSLSVSKLDNFDNRDLSLTDKEREKIKSDAASKDQLKEVERDARRAKMSPRELAADLQKEVDEAKKKFDAAKAEEEAQKSVKNKQQASARRQTEDTSNLAIEEAKLRDLRALMEEREKVAGSLAASEVQDVGGPDSLIDYEKLGRKGDETLKAFLTRLDKEEADLVKRIEELQANVADKRSGMEDALSGDSKIEIIKAQISLRDQAAQSEDEVVSMRNSVLENKDATQDERDELDFKERKFRSLLELARKYNVSLNAGDQSRDQVELEILEEKFKKESDIVELKKKQIEAQRAMEDAQLNAASRRFDVEKSIIGLKDLGIAGDLKQLEIERQKLDLRLKAKDIGEEEYRNQKDLILAEEEAIERRAAEKNQDAVTATRITQFEVEEEAAKRAGDVAAAQIARQRRDQLELEQVTRKAREEAKGLWESEAGQNFFVDEQVEAYKKSRDQKRKFEEEDMARARQASKEEQAINYGALREDILRYQGKTEAAEAAERQTNALRDASLLKEQKRKYIEEGFSEGDASDLADRDVASSQAARELDKLKSAGTGEIVSSSLARIGGGGGVSGNDPVGRRIDITNELLRKILKKEGGIDLGVN